MSLLVDIWEQISAWIPALLVLVNLLAVVLTIGWVLMTKTDSTSAVAWSLLIFFLPFVGAVLFYFFGYQHVNRPLKRKRKHKARYHLAVDAGQHDGAPARAPFPKQSISDSLSRLAYRCGAYPVTFGNQLDFYDNGGPAFDAMIAAIQNARHHIHIMVFIFQPDRLGRQFLDLLTAKAKDGVEVRLLYDAMGSHRLPRRLLRPLHEAGGRSSVFLPINIFRRRLQINMRNHRKIMVIDGKVGFLGGLNIGDEYLGQVARFGYWRDTHLRIEGPAVMDLQRLFVEDWSFAAGENLQDDVSHAPEYFQAGVAGGTYPAQIVDSGPDRDLKAIREVCFAAILRAQRRLWIASPYFVPDAGLLDALRLAAYNGIDVRLLGQLKPDKWIPQFAARYYWAQVLPAGVKVYQYKKGMMHAKVILVDNEFVSVGTANLDNRSMHLNFEVNCLIYSDKAAARLEESFMRDFEEAILLDRNVYAQRPFAGRLVENACRLLSPIL